MFVLMIEQPVVKVVKVHVRDGIARRIAARCGDRVPKQRVLQRVLKQEVLHGLLVAKDNA